MLRASLPLFEDPTDSVDKWSRSALVRAFLYLLIDSSMSFISDIYVPLKREFLFGYITSFIEIPISELVLRPWFRVRTH